MVDTRKNGALASLHREADIFRKSLVNKGFIDDGKELRGGVEWQHDGERHVAVVAVRITDRFPFAPPAVSIIDCGELKPTFHRETNGDLCLWTSEYSLEQAPWVNSEVFLEKVAGWFAETENGWLGDDDADLERYLSQDHNIIVLYDAEQLASGKFYRTQKRDDAVVNIVEELRWLPSTSRKKQRGIRRREKDLCYVIDAGSVSHPILNWEDLARATGRDFTETLRLVQVGSLKYMLVKYSRGGREAYLALGFNKHGELISYESADSSNKTRTLRAGENANVFASKNVIVFGAGAIGSHVIDILFRSGVRKIKIVDPERLRPGNIVRHLAGNDCIGQYKALAVKSELARLGLPIDDVEAIDGRVQNPDDLLKAVKGFDLIVDTTADNRASSMLSWAAKQSNTRMVSASLQRDGGIARIDRFPLWEGEAHLPAVPVTTDSTERYEQGCGSPVSMTPPGSVVRAASLAASIALDQLRMIPHIPDEPPTVIDVIIPQADTPYDEVGLLMTKSAEINHVL